jgi:hypothetical protein
MNSVIYVIGVDHRLQHNGQVVPPRAGVRPLRAEFRRYLADVVARHSISVIAEELSYDLLGLLGASESTAKSIAEALKIRHEFCDLDRAARSSLGIGYPSREEHSQVRERFWYERILPYLDRKVIFICGAKHVASFERLANRKGSRTTVLTPFFAEWFFAPRRNRSRFHNGALG